MQAVAERKAKTITCPYCLNVHVDYYICEGQRNSKKAVSVVENASLEALQLSIHTLTILEELYEQQGIEVSLISDIMNMKAILTDVAALQGKKRANVLEMQTA